MPTTDALNLGFDEAIEYFRGKVNIPTRRWDDLRRDEHDWAWSVAGVASVSLLQDVRAVTDRAISEGISYQEFKKQFQDAISRKGWTEGKSTAFNLDLIYRQNLYQSYAAGRYQQQQDPELLKLKPYLRYRHGGSNEPRPTHIALDGKVFPAKSKFWDRWYPPNGFGCRCFVQSLGDRDLEREGLTVDKAPSGAYMTVPDPATGQPRKLRNAPDPGFDYAPGKSVLKGKRDELLSNILARLDPDLRKQVKEFNNNIPPIEPLPELPLPSLPQTWQEFVQRGEQLFSEDLAKVDAERLSFRKQEQMEKLRQKLFDQGLSEREARKLAKQVEVKRPVRVKFSREVLTDLYRLTNGQAVTLKRLIKTDSRAWASRTGAINVGIQKNDITATRVLYHEFGHHLEYSNSITFAAAKTWVEDRATGTEQPLSVLTGINGYGPNETALPDHWVDPYVGKLYPRATEVVSMGLEQFRSERAMLKLYETDREHFLLILGMLR